MIVRILFCLLLIFSGCSSMKILSKPIKKPKLNISINEPLQLSDIEFFILTEENFSSVFSELKRSGYEPVIIGLSGTGYKLLSININKIKNFIMLQNEIIKQYKNYYEFNTESN